MARRALCCAWVAAAALTGFTTSSWTSPGSVVRAAHVARVVDGDTLALAGEARVRLLQIDAPELGSGECYSRRAAGVLRSLVPAGTRVRLHADRRLDRVDRYGRLLRYVFRHELNVNIALVRRGAATVWFYGGVRGRYARRLLAAARRARAQKRGLWGACRARRDPYRPAATWPKRHRHRGRRCDPSYPTVCIPPPPPDLDCGDIRYRRFKVVGRDPHHFDGDHDGVGCEVGYQTRTPAPAPSRAPSPTA
jgi:endonuclease YncB( thermonuclease family)